MGEIVERRVAAGAIVTRARRAEITPRLYGMGSLGTVRGNRDL